jgi:XTP/dITP diphosphohydrolase
MQGTRRRVLLATRNQGKTREIAGVLADLALELVSLLEYPNITEVEETGATFRENARLKAEYFWRHTGLPSLADDSGLVVQSLDGQPGVLSARFAPTDAQRNLKLLELLRAHQTPTQRSASFVCAVCLYSDNDVIEVEASVDGYIAPRPAGIMGFGYDPVFFYPPQGKTFAEMTAEEKNRVSHRARALNRLRQVLLEKEEWA